jgi:N-acetylneuraminic acid mutarotase
MISNRVDRKVICKFVLSRLLLPVFLFLLISPSHVSAESLSISVKESFLNNGLSKNLTVLDEGHGVRLSSDGYWGALSWRSPDKTIGVGSAFASDGRYLYVVRGYADILFWRYDAETDTWKELANLPKGVYYGADLQYLDGYIYALFGGYQKSFARYSIEDDSWELLANYPDLTYSGTSTTTDGTDIYAVTGDNTQSFYKYTVSTDTWTPLSGSPGTFRYGADLVHINGYIYTPRGNNTNTFYRYDISQDSWTTLESIPDLVRDDIDITTDGTYIFLARQYNSTDFFRYEIATDTWTTIASAPSSSRYAGVQYLDYDGYVYFFRGNGQTDFWKYDIANDRFVGPADSPAPLRTGSDGFYHEGVVYVARGSNTNEFYAYDSSLNSWSPLTGAPDTFNSDVRGVIIDSSIYMFRGSSTQDFYRYNIDSDTWSLLEPTPLYVNYGAMLAYPGEGDYIYATRGLNTSTFWRYSISQDIWELTISDLPSGVFASFGSTIVANSTDVFFSGGRGLKVMYKYNIATDQWTELEKLPFAAYYGTDVAFDGDDRILFLSGYYSEEVWEYTISTDSWRRLKNLSGYEARSIGPYTGASIIYMEEGNYLVTRGNNRSDVLIYSHGDLDYETYGTWSSDTYDLVYVDSWDSLTIEQVNPGDSYITVQTRTGLDGVNWSEWEDVSGGVISSPENRYIQFKVFLYPSSDGSLTPIFKGLDINYVSDENPPTTPASVVAYSREISGEELVEEEGYDHVEPYFVWEESLDLEGNVVGYYVYFGPESDANPVTEGSFQMGNFYRVTQAIDVGVNYLRIVAEDESGNRSAAVTGFEYDYIGVGPYLTFSVESNEMNGDFEGVTVGGAGLHLEHSSGGFWFEAYLESPPFTFHYGTKNVAYVEDTGKFYVPSGNDAEFYEYDTVNNLWTRLADSPERSYYGGGVVEGPEGYIYMLKGENSREFWIYDIVANTWSTEVSNSPLTVGYGGSSVFDGTQYIYVLRGNNSDVFWRYDTFSDSWENLASVDFGAPSNNINNNAYIGASLAIDVENRIIYATQGSLRSALSVYNIDMDTWEPSGDLPSLPYYGASLEYDPNTEALYYQGGYNLPYFYKYEIASGEWVQLSDLPIGFYYGGGVHRAGDTFYGFRGSNTRDFFRYDVERDSWLLPQRGLFGREYQGSSLFGAHYGADIVKGDGENYYIMRGNFSDDFVRWNSETGEVTRMARVPNVSYVGGSLAYDSVNNKIYTTVGIYDPSFFVYDVESNTWSEETQDPLPIEANQGGDMVFDGTRYLYFSRGIGTNFYRFDPQGASGEKWLEMSTILGSLGYGSDLAISGDYVYTMRGANVSNNPLYRYSTTLGSWDELTPSDFQMYVGGFLVDGNNGSLYAAPANNVSDFYEYNLLSNSWSKLSNMPVNVRYGGSAESSMDGLIHMMPGSATGSYDDGIYTYVTESEESSFLEEGLYTSNSYDLESVYKWADLVVDYDLADNTNISIQTSTSEDEIEWEEWSDVSRKRELGGSFSYKINSTPARYIKLRIGLNSGEGVRTPKVNSYTINYYQDITPPQNPDVLGVSVVSEIDSNINLTSGQWYNHSQPYFEWAEPEAEYGASDGENGSGVSGYYLYWGSEEEEEPEEGVFVEENFYVPENLVDGSTYYLKIKAVDLAGNVSEDILEAFTYKYDSVIPTAPAEVSADPSGYTAVASFDFSWEEVIKEGASVIEYCYKTGATSGDFSEDQCIEEPFVEDVPPYRIGPNVFYVRAKDEAGNFSLYGQVSYFYVDAENAPAPPTNLTVTPETSTSNSFGFQWDSPATGTFYGSESNLSYLYSVNALPTEHSVSSTSLKYLNPGAYATLPGENIFYIVTKDEAGNVNYNDYSQVSFFANTVAPGIPIDMEIADVSVKSASAWRLAVSWEEPEDVGSGVSSYRVFRSIDGENFYLHTSTGGASLVDSKLQQRIHYYKVQACDSTNNCGAFSQVVQLYPDGRYTEPAELIVEPMIRDITPKRATVSWITDRTSDSRVAYGLESGVYFEEEVSNSEHVMDHSLTMNNLTPGTRYYYVVKWTDEDGNTGTSEEAFFETAPPPSIEEPVVKRVGLTSALIEFKTKESTKVRVYYGESSSFGGVVEVFTGLEEGIRNVELTELKDGVKYYYRINTFDIDGSEYEGEIHSFETLPRPRVSDINIYQVSGTAATTLLVEWTSNTPISSIVTYYPSSSPEMARDEVNVKLRTGEHRMVLLNLNPNEQYSIIVRGQDFMGNEAISEVNVFNTAADTRPPKVFDLEVNPEIIGVGDEATAQLVVSFKTDELGTSQVEYGEGTGTSYSQKTQEDKSLANNHIVIVSGLTPGKVYHLRALSLDEEGNVGNSIDKVVVTPAGTENALDLAISNLTSIFSFLGRGR